MAEVTGGVDGAEEGTEAFLIEELSRRTGLTVRSIRSYQSRKLLPPPEVRGRTGYYDQRHVARIELIKDLQSEGLKLHSIARMLDSAAATDADLLRFTRSVQSLFGDSSGTLSSRKDLRRRFGVDESAADAVLARAVKLGLVRSIGDDSYEELSPRLLSAGEHAVHALGLDADSALQIVAQLRRHADAVARMYLDLFVERVWAPFVAAEQPPEQWAVVEGALQEMRHLATEALLSAFELVMSERVHEAFGRELTRSRR